MICGQCGEENKEGARFCSGCGSSLTPEIIAAEHPTSPPAIVIPPAAPSTAPPIIPAPQPVLVAGFGLASLWRRFFAVVLDLFIITGLGAMFVAWEAARWNAYRSNYSITLNTVQTLLSTLVPAVFAFIYYWLMEAIFGATLGKAMVDIQVRRKSGEGPGLGGAMIRNLARIIDVLPALYIIGFFTALFSKLKQRVGDHLAGTVVVRREGVFLVVAGIILWLAAMGAMSWKTYRLYRNAHPPMNLPQLHAAEPQRYSTAFASLRQSC